MRSIPYDELGPEQATPAVVRHMRGRFEDVARGSGAATVVEKTCANSLRVAFVNRILPEARYLFIVRDGRDAAASAVERFSAPLDWRYTLRKLRYAPAADLALLRGPVRAQPCIAHAPAGPAPLHSGARAFAASPNSRGLRPSRSSARGNGASASSSPRATWRRSRQSACCG
jgi:hypothetical protein